MSSHTRIVGDPNNRKYLDCLGKPLSIGDTVVWFVARSSSVDWNIGVVDKIVDNDHPAYIGYEPDTPPGHSERIESWDTAYTLRVKRLTKIHPLEHVWEPPKRYDYANGQSIRTPQRLDDLRTSTIRAVERVVKVDVETDLR